MAAERFYLPAPMAFGSNGLSSPGALANFFYTGTDTRAPVYSNVALDTELPNPVQADGAGRFPAIYIDSAITYRLKITDKDGVSLGVDEDPYIPLETVRGLQGETGPAGTATSNSGVVTSWSSQTANTAASSEMHILTAPTVPFANSAGGDDGIRVSLIANVGKFTQGPTGHEIYHDTVASFGLNQTQSYTRVNPNIASISFRMESKFAQGGPTDVLASEAHISAFSIDGDKEFRAFTTFIPHHSDDWVNFSGTSIRGANINIMDGGAPTTGGNQRIAINLQPGSNLINLDRAGAEPAPSISHGSNNRFFARQINAAGNAFISHPFANAVDRLEASAPGYQVAPIKVDGVFGIPTLNVYFGLNMPEGGYQEFGTFTGTPNTAYAKRFDAPCATAIIDQLYNVTTTGKAIKEVVSNGGPCLFVANPNAGGGTWSAGAEGVTGEYRIANANQTIAAAIGFRLKPSSAAVAYAVEFTGPVGLPQYTVGGLPSPTAVRTGSIVYITNETGGAQPGFSDGTNWRRQSDRAIAA